MYLRHLSLIASLIASLVSPMVSGGSVSAQEQRGRRAQDEKEKEKKEKEREWPAKEESVVRKASEGDGVVRLAEEPVMRIALSTGTRTATISTTAHLLNASEVKSSTQPLDFARVRIESRMLSPARSANERTYDIAIANSLSREDAERMVESVHQLTGENARPVAESAGKWSVVISAQSREDAEATTAKLEEAGFEVL